MDDSSISISKESSISGSRIDSSSFGPLTISPIDLGTVLAKTRGINYIEVAQNVKKLFNNFPFSIYI